MEPSEDEMKRYELTCDCGSRVEFIAVSQWQAVNEFAKLNYKCYKCRGILDAQPSRTDSEPSS